MEEIYECGCAWPYFALQFASVSIFNKNSSCFSLNVCCTIVDFDAGIYDRHVVIAICDLFHGIEWESGFINGEVFVVDHIVDISPDGIKGEAV